LNLAKVLEKCTLDIQREDDIGSNIQVIFRPNAMFGGEPSKHNDEIKVKVSKLWKPAIHRHKNHEHKVAAHLSI